MSSIEFLVLALATWRISHMFVQEAGPFYVFTKIRASRGIVHNIEGEPVGVPANRLLGCIWCTSVWVALVLYLLPVQVSYPFALSAVACLLTKLR